MILYSSRLKHEKFTSDQFDDYFRWYGDNLVMDFINGLGLTQDVAQYRFDRMINDNELHEVYGLYRVVGVDTADFVGITKFQILSEGVVEVGYGLLPQYWHKGLATEMLQSLIDLAQSQIDIHTLVGLVNPLHVASIRVLTKQNFRLESTANENDEELDKYTLVLR